jgi:AcrR family transcriptional regulator
MARPPNADSAKTYDAIVAAARKLLFETEDSKIDFSLRQVAASANVSQGTLSYYFNSKEELLEACLDVYYERLEELVSELMARASSFDSPGEFIAAATRDLYRLERQDRRELRLRRITNARRWGGLDPAHSRSQLLGHYLDTTSGLLASLTGRPPEDMRLVIQSVTTLIQSYVTLTDGEVEKLLGDSSDAARQKLEDHVVEAAVAIAVPSER